MMISQPPPSDGNDNGNRASGKTAWLMFHAFLSTLFVFVTLYLHFLVNWGKERLDDMLGVGSSRGTVVDAAEQVFVTTHWYLWLFPAAVLSLVLSMLFRNQAPAIVAALMMIALFLFITGLIPIGYWLTSENILELLYQNAIEMGLLDQD